MSKRDEYAASMKQQIDEMNQNIDEVENVAKALRQSFNYVKSQL